MSGETPAPPYWSVILPTYRPREHELRQALASVLAQDPGASSMQLEVVDDCTPEGSVAEMVQRIAGERVCFSQTPRNLGLAGCWNHCLQRARGRWIHLLHQDDFVHPGFYRRLAEAAEQHPDVHFLAARNFVVDEENVIVGVSSRLVEMERPTHAVKSFWGQTPVQCPAIAVRAAAYARVGDFRSDLVYTLDIEMWTRVVHQLGGLVLPDILASYRSSGQSESSRLGRSFATFADRERLHEIYATLYPEFDRAGADRQLALEAYAQIFHQRALGQPGLALKARDFYRRNAPWNLRARLFGERILSKLTAR